MPPTYSAKPSMLRVCSSCAETVERKDCHKNRYSQYICRRCQISGAKSAHGAPWRYFARRRSLLKWTLSAVFLCVIIGGMVNPASFADILASNFISLLGSKMEPPIDTRGGVLLSAENKAFVIQGLDQVDPPPGTEEPINALPVRGDKLAQ